MASLAVGVPPASVAVIMYYASALVAVVSVAGYHLSIKAQSPTVNPFLPLAAAYFIAFFVCVAGLFFWSDGSRSLTALRPSVVWLALSVVGIEVGFLLAYRAGWKHTERHHHHQQCQWKDRGREQRCRRSTG